jgi:PIN domain nuclease of toxin-antitoxin system
MMYLLDTHTYYWFRTSPSDIPASTMALLTDPSHEILISIATPWELAIKTGAGRLPASDLLVDFESRETAAGFTMVGITIAQVIRSGLLPRHHKDPFDRLLAAQALDLRIPIVSRDAILDAYGVRRIWN